MSASTPTPVVRRSALEARHEALGATFASDVDRWPRHYGDADAERVAVSTGAGLAELGPYGEVLLRGPGSADLVTRLTGGASSSQRSVIRATLGGRIGAAWCLGPDEVLLVAAAGPWTDDLAEHLSGADVSAMDMTGARTTLRLAGPAAPAILAELCQADTTPRSMADGALVQAPLAGVRAFTTRLDADGAPGYTMMVARDEAAYVWDALREIGAAHGLVPVGPDAVGADGGTR
ncbi:MAG: hypothetical protein WEC14_01765 [Chloroflexota bacterium]